MLEGSEAKIFDLNFAWSDLPLGFSGSDVVLLRFLWKVKAVIQPCGAFEHTSTNFRTSLLTSVASLARGILLGLEHQSSVRSWNYEAQPPNHTLTINSLGILWVGTLATVELVGTSPSLRTIRFAYLEAQGHRVTGPRKCRHITQDQAVEIFRQCLTHWDV